ncbi:MAG: hypothetical protein HOL48_10575 [Porticoccaceae bacterium]|nr:hypothetical protein [Porticoccaceae bacterium]
MKVTVDIDLTPEEARTMLGLPDMQPMQESVMKRLEEKMLESLDEMSQPDYLFKRFFPVGMQGMEEFSRMTQEVMSKTMNSNKEEEG